MAIGGGSRSRYWLETIATSLNISIACPSDGEYGAALGAARLAILGKTGEPIKNILSQPAISEVIEPRQDLIDDYYQAFKLTKTPLTSQKHSINFKINLLFVVFPAQSWLASIPPGAIFKMIYLINL